MSTNFDSELALLPSYEQWAQPIQAARKVDLINAHEKEHVTYYKEKFAPKSRTGTTSTVVNMIMS